MKKILFTLLSVIAFAILTSSQTFACSCMMPGSPSEEAERVDRVFVGEVIEIKEEGVVGELFGGMMENKVTFNVSSNIKGTKNKTVTLKTASSGAACGYYFEENKEYIVYASDYKGELNASLCSRTSLLENAEKDLEEFEEYINNGSDEERGDFKSKLHLTDLYIVIGVIIFMVFVIIITSKEINKKN